MFFVASLTSVSNPPMTPANAIGPFNVGDHQVFRRQLAFLLVERDQDFAFAPRDETVIVGVLPSARLTRTS